MSSLDSYAYSEALSLFQPRLTSWESRVYGRGLTVDNFGDKAEGIIRDAEDRYDGLSAAVLTAASGGEGLKERRAKKQKVMEVVEEGIRGLWERQMEDVKDKVKKDFKRDMLRNFKVDRNTGEKVVQDDGNSPGSLMRKAVFEFERRTDELEVLRLGLVKTKAAQDLSNELASLIDNFDASPAAQLKVMSTIKKSASKPKPPSERGVTPTFHLVSMIRPDGFGNLQGFAGYNFGGGHTVTVGVCNDADSPEVLNGFGGMRPPLIRIQPKVNIDVDL
ncbi:hypothetical protein TrRE_jg12902 [Triparma retinervis]|uniref:Uncharacterized protein n=1 Tax=Triparma retinervis TaxID=2557542 RepID=A0A9W7FZL7_9STRA|nr:hypothetical protein TrRE_jg12902 [Triparma retinervis]